MIAIAKQLCDLCELSYAIGRFDAAPYGMQGQLCIWCHFLCREELGLTASRAPILPGVHERVLATRARNDVEMFGSMPIISEPCEHCGYIADADEFTARDLSPLALWRAWESGVLGTDGLAFVLSESEHPIS